MNRTNFEHAAWALLMQVVIGLLSGDWWAGAAAGAFFFIGREHAQAQAKLDDYSLRGDLAACDLRRWSLDARLDLLCPVLAVLAVALMVRFL